MHIGRHMPVSPRPAEALRLTQLIGGDAVQIFVTNPRAWRAPSPRPRDEAEFRGLLGELGHWPVVVHAAYLINLASPNDDFFAKSVEALHLTLERAALFNASSVVFHIGSHTGSGEEAGLRRLIEGVDRALDGSPATVRLLLENDVGGGGKLGARFETIAAALDALPQHAERLGVCLDTAHLWGAGFDIGSAEGVEATLSQADAVFGLGRVHVIHLNDSRGALTSHRDHHARLGEGTIPLEGLAAFLRTPQLAHTTTILETPLTMIGEAPDGAASAASDQSDAEDEATARPAQVDWDAERRRLFQACELAGTA
ncbi:MAG TPA: deoxyribonuclease IV [Ktedonobacterales bacterium]|nr:deoxyribonuclease IV [Ktedonobacterales bacterium]